MDSLSIHRPRNLDGKRASALLYGDWGTSKAYVIGLAFAASGFSSFPIILAACALTALVGLILLSARFLTFQNLEPLHESLGHG